MRSLLVKLFLMRLGNTLKDPRPYSLPPRDALDVVGTCDLSSLLTTVRGVNPFDVSPGIQLILEKLEMRPKSANPYVQYTNTLNMDKDTIGQVTDQRGNTALHVAAGCGYTQIVEALLDECAASVDPVNEDGLTPLHLATMNGHVECVQRLCSAGADAKLTVQFDTKSTSVPFLTGRTSLFLSHWYQHPVVELMLKSFGAGTIRGNTADANRLWRTAAAGQDVKVFALLFDVLDCRGSDAVRPLDIPCIIDALPELANDLPTVLSHLLPPHSQLSPAQLFIFEGLVTRQLVGAESSVAATTEGAVTVLDRILVAGHTEAFKILKIDVSTCDPPLSLRVFTHDDSEEGQILLHLIQEAEQRHQAAAALAAYQRHTKSKRLKREAIAARQKWFESQQALEAKNVAPLP